MKIKQVKLQFFRLVGIIAALLAILSFGLWFFGSFIGEQEEYLEKTKTLIMQNTAETVTLKAKHKESEEAFGFYKDFVEKHGTGNAYSRETLKSLLAELKNSEGIIELKYNMEAFRELSENLRKDTAVAISSTIKIQVNALNDVPLYNLIEDIQAGLPGSVVIKRINIQKATEVSDSLLANIASGNIPNVVTMDVEMEWMGIKELERVDNAAK